MTKTTSIIIIYILILFSCCKPADNDNEFDNGSGIQIDNINSLQTERLVSLAKIWGFLKYYHPIITEGKLNWDNELIRVLPKTLDLKTDFNDVFKLLTNQLNTGKGFANYSHGEAYPKVDYRWIDELKLLSNKNKLILKDVISQERSKKHYYVKLENNVNNPKFLHERHYSNLKFTDDGIKLVGLFRFWASINYFYPYKHLLNKNWDTILADYIPDFLDSDTKDLYMQAIAQLLTELKDAHAKIKNNDFYKNLYGKNIAPIQLNLEGDSVAVVTNYFENSEKFTVKPGDRILKIDGKDISSKILKLEPTICAGNNSVLNRQLERLLVRTNSDSMKILFKRNGKNYSVTEKTLSYESVDIYKTNRPAYKILENNIGYYSASHMEEGSLDGIMSKLINTDGLIVDLRGYPKEFIAYELSEYFAKNTVPFAIFSKTSLLAPGSFQYTKPVKIDGNSERAYTGKILVLVNERTQSQAEFTAMALQSCRNVRTLGSQTAGANGNISQIVFPGKIVTIFTGIGVLYPDKTEMQRAGIKIDIPIDYVTNENLKEKDQFLQKAIDLLNNNK